MSDNAPTQRLTTVPDSGEPRSRTLLYVLIGIGALLLIAVIVLIATLLSGRGAEPTATPTETASASPSPTPTETEASPSPTPSESEDEGDDGEDPAPDTEPGFTSFSAPATETGCPTGGGPFDAPTPTIRVAWATKNAESVWFVYGTSDAANAQAYQLPNNGDEDNFDGDAPPFPCGGPKGSNHTFTLTLVGTDGSHVSRSWTVTDNSPY